MPDHDPRIERIRADFARLEAAYLLFSHAPPKSPTGGGWRAALSSVGDFLLKAAPVATSVWVALVAYFVNDRVQHALDCSASCSASSSPMLTG